VLNTNTSALVLLRTRVTYKTGFWIAWLELWHFINLYTRNYRQYSAIGIQHAFQFTFTHALMFSVFTSRILATDFSQPHCNFKSHMKSSCHRLIPFLQLFCSYQFRRLDSIQLLTSWHAGVPKLDSSLLDYSARSVFVYFYNPSERTTQKTRSLLLRRRVYWSV
jgi:hypothetical protein